MPEGVGGSGGAAKTPSRGPVPISMPTGDAGGIAIGLGGGGTGGRLGLGLPPPLLAYSNADIKPYRSRQPPACPSPPWGCRRPFFGWWDIPPLHPPSGQPTLWRCLQATQPLPIPILPWGPPPRPGPAAWESPPHPGNRPPIHVPCSRQGRPCPRRVPYQVSGQLGEDGEGGELAALAFGVRWEGLQGLAALRVPVSQASIPD